MRFPSPQCFGLLRRIVAITLAALAVAPIDAAQRQWIALRTPRFGVVSQLNEKATRNWATEFDKFVAALESLYGIKEADLPPLTMVLFAQTRDFARYRPSDETAGVFAHTTAWSTIGLAGLSSSQATRHVVYHEGVHWFSRAFATEPPLWFEEGLAHVFSTFEVKDGKARWGTASRENVVYLNLEGLRPMETVLQVSRDDPIETTGQYQPQWWAFVHYLMFANAGARSKDLVKFVQRLRETDVDTAFVDAFGMSFDSMTNELRRYLANGRYNIAEMAVPDRSAEMTLAPATPIQVEFALGRLAFGTGKYELAREHAERVVALAPGASAGYELLALVAFRTGQSTALASSLDRAIELGSNDAIMYEIKGFRVVEDNWLSERPADDTLPPDAARTAADLFERSLSLLPDNAHAFEGLATALLNVDEVRGQDEAVLMKGRRVLPTNGFVVVGQAAIENRRGNVREAARLLNAATHEPMTLPPRMTPAIRGLRDQWLIEWSNDELRKLMESGDFDSAQTLVTDLLDDDWITGLARSSLERTGRDIAGFARIDEAMREGGRTSEARARLREIADDDTESTSVRNAARRLLDQVPQRR